MATKITKTLLFTAFSFAPIDSGATQSNILQTSNEKLNQICQIFEVTKIVRTTFDTCEASYPRELIGQSPNGSYRCNFVSELLFLITVDNLALLVPPVFIDREFFDDCYSLEGASNPKLFKQHLAFPHYAIRPSSAFTDADYSIFISFLEKKKIKNTDHPEFKTSQEYYDHFIYGIQIYQTMYQHISETIPYDDMLFSRVYKYIDNYLSSPTSLVSIKDPRDADQILQIDCPLNKMLKSLQIISILILTRTTYGDTSEEIYLRTIKGIFIPLAHGSLTENSLQELKSIPSIIKKDRKEILDPKNDWKFLTKFFLPLHYNYQKR